MTNLQRGPTRSRRRQLTSVNDRISEFNHATSESNIYGVFALAARLARRAGATALDLRKAPEVEAKELESVLDFWARLSDYAGAAALNCIGGNQTLTEAVITYEFLVTARERKEENDAR
jgi:hypothetical protein